MQNSVISARITSLYESQPSLVDFACKTATLGSELQVPMGSRPHLWFCAFKTASFGSELQISMGPRLRLLICECKTACLDPE